MSGTEFGSTCYKERAKGEEEGKTLLKPKQDQRFWRVYSRKKRGIRRGERGPAGNEWSSVGCTKRGSWDTGKAGNLWQECGACPWAVIVAQIIFPCSLLSVFSSSFVFIFLVSERTAGD